MANYQFYGLKFPFTSNKERNDFVDLNYTNLEYVKSQIMHVLFTPKGSKIHDPLFGTDLIKYIFEENDSITWNSIKNECKAAISTYVKNCTLNNLEVVKSDDEMHDIFVKLNFSASINGQTVNNSIVTKI